MEDPSSLQAPPLSDTKQCIKARNVLGIMGFLGFANVYAMRVNLSVAIVAMVNTTFIPSKNDSTDVCPDNSNSTSLSSVWESYYNPSSLKSGDFNWDENQRGIVLGSFFYGYVLLQIPGGRLAELYGGKKVFGLGVFFTALFTLLSPILAFWSFPMFVAIRVLEGFAEGVTFPAMHAMLARWVPPNDRSKFAAIVYAGSSFGTVISFPISGWLCTLDFAGGWPLCFYLFGATGVIWFFFWLFLVYDTPLSHPRICPKERDFILNSIGSRIEQEPRSIPWKHFAKSLPLWAILITQFGQSWQFYTQLNELPTYMSDILHMNIKQSAIYSALPALSSWIAGIFISLFADYLISKNYIKRVNSFKFWNTVASVAPALGILGVALIGCDKTNVVMFLFISSAFSGAVYSGYYMNHMALSPQYAGTMFGITNAVANTCGFIVPSVVGVLIEGRETLGQWRLVFYLAAAVNIASNLFYLAFASAKEERWSLEESADFEESSALVQEDDS